VSLQFIPKDHPFYNLEGKRQYCIVLHRPLRRPAFIIDKRCRCRSCGYYSGIFLLVWWGGVCKISFKFNVSVKIVVAKHYFGPETLNFKPKNKIMNEIKYFCPCDNRKSILWLWRPWIVFGQWGDEMLIRKSEQRVRITKPCADLPLETEKIGSCGYVCLTLYTRRRASISIYKKKKHEAGSGIAPLPVQPGAVLASMNYWKTIWN
jgi:hypothetical protein